MADLRLGLVGCGWIAACGYVPALSLVKGVRLVGVADPIRSRCEFVASGVPAFDGVEGLTAAGGLDAVVIATPPGRHLEDARVATAAGVSVLVEKPPGVDAAEARQLAALQPAPWIGFNRRFEPGLVRLRSALPAEEIELALEFRTRPSLGHSRVPQGEALLELGPHLLDLACWLSRSEPVSVRALELSPRRAVLDLELERARARISCSRDGLYRESVTVSGRAGRPIAVYRKGGFRARLARRLRSPTEDPLVLSLAAQLEAFAAAARGERTPQLGAAVDGVAVMAVIDAARRSFELGGARCPIPVA